MSGTRLALGLFAFQLPAVALAFLGAVGSMIFNVTGDWIPYLALPLAVCALLGSLATWGLESLWPLPEGRRWNRLVRYQLPTLIFTLLPIGAYAFLAGAMFSSRFHWDNALLVSGGLFGGYLVVVGVPYFFLARFGAVTPVK